MSLDVYLTLKGADIQRRSSVASLSVKTALPLKYRRRNGTNATLTESQFVSLHPNQRKWMKCIHPTSLTI